MPKTIAVLALTTACLVLLGPMSAANARPHEMQPLLNPDGSGRLFANPGGPDDQFHWESCFPDETTCTALSVGREISTGDGPIGTVFRFSPESVSEPWGGTVASLGAPSISGVARANELVTPLSAGWQGGWPHDTERTQLAACVGADETSCVTLTDPKYPGNCADGAAVIDPYFTGRYLRVAVTRLGEGSAETGEAHTLPYNNRVGEKSAVTAVRFYGPIEAAVGAKQVNCGPRPITEAEIDKKAVATIRCDLECNAVMIARSRGKTVASVETKLESTRAREFKNGKDSLPKLRLKKVARKRLAGRKVSVQITVEGQLAGRRNLRLSGKRPGA